MIDGERPLRAFLEPIAGFLRDPGVTEVVVNKPGEVGVECQGKWSFCESPDLTFDRLDQMGILACYASGREFDGEHPIGLATLPDGQRFTICRPPVTASGTISVTVRVPSQTVRRIDDEDFDGLVRNANLGPESQSKRTDMLRRLYKSKDWQAFFRLAVQSGKTILATGVTGSGKTTFLRTMLQEIPLHERLVTIEDTNEFGVLPHHNRVSLFYGSAGVTAEDTVMLALRQRPDRIIMQELRGSEAFAFMRAMLAGHGGGQTTLHADRGEDAAFEALAVMVKTHPAGKEIPDEKLMPLLRRLVDIVAWCSRDDDGFHVPYVWFRDAEPGEGK
jgi:type IV secretion system protein VirB11